LFPNLSDVYTGHLILSGSWNPRGYSGLGICISQGRKGIDTCRQNFSKETSCEKFIWKIVKKIHDNVKKIREASSEAWK
jgi:hypothetical protein